MKRIGLASLVLLLLIGSIAAYLANQKAQVRQADRGFFEAFKSYNRPGARWYVDPAYDNIWGSVIDDKDLRQDFSDAYDAAVDSLSNETLVGEAAEQMQTALEEAAAGISLEGSFALPQEYKAIILLEGTIEALSKKKERLARNVVLTTKEMHEISKRELDHLEKDLENLEELRQLVTMRPLPDLSEFEANANARDKLNERTDKLRRERGSKVAELEANWELVSNELDVPGDLVEQAGFIRD